MPERVESFAEFKHSKNRTKARLGFVKLIRNGPRKEQNSIESRPSRAKASLVGRENGVRLHKVK